ncbi:MAG: hypothetical protein R2838_01080 [Caldilineaceae bacterium]
MRIMLPMISGQPQETPPEVAEDGRCLRLATALLLATEQSFATHSEPPTVKHWPRRVHAQHRDGD